MNWKFWNNNKDSANKDLLEKVLEEVSLINRKTRIMEEHLQEYDDTLQGVNDHLDYNGDLVQKSLRLQYKYNQEIIKGFEETNMSINKNIDYNKKYIEIKSERDILINEKNYILEKNIQWLDDIDSICNEIHGQGGEYWIELLHSWQKQVLDFLSALEIHEIDVIGKSFNPNFAEAIGTKRKEENKEYIPYEVVSLIQRGFIIKENIILRKAKVITIEEEEYEKYE